MKTQILSLTALFAFAAHAEHYPNAKLKIDWNDKATLSGSIVQVCDDTYYPAVEVIVPGDAGKDFTIEMNVDISEGSIEPGCTVKKREGLNSTTYILDSSSSGGCSVEVFQLHPKFGESRKSAVFDIHDAC